MALLPLAEAYGQDDAALLRDGLFARDRNISVAERPKPEYQALPVRLGAWLVQPSLAAALAYDDNLYATATGGVGDESLRLRGGLTAASDWARNQASLFATAQSVQYVDHASEDDADYALGGAGRLDIHHDLGLTAGFSQSRASEPRTDEASPPGALHPVRYDVSQAWVEGAAVLDRLRLTVRGGVDDYSYGNARSDTGAPLYQRDRDRSAVDAVLKADYAYTPEIAFTFSLAGDRRDYRNALPGEVSRSGTGYEAAAGIDFDLTHLVRGAVQAGYLERDYDHGAFYKAVSGLGFRGRLDYFLTPLITIAVSGSRAVQDSGLYNVGGYLASTAAVQVDHELLRNLVLSGRLGLAEDRYQNHDRTDRIGAARFGLAYLMNRALSLEASYTRLSRSSAGADAGPRYRIGRALVDLKWAL